MFSKLKFTKANLLGIVVGVLAATLSYSLIECSSNPLVEKQLDEAVQEVNSKCPMLVDAQTRLDNAMRPTKEVFQYNYTLINLKKEDINVDQVTENLRPTMVNNVKTNPQLGFFRENKITMSYVYKDKEGVFVMKIDIKPEDYM